MPPVRINTQQKAFASHGARIILFAFLLVLIETKGYAQTPDEYQVKAVFIYNFTHFIEWPNSAFEQSDSPFVIGVLGPNVFGSGLEEIVAGEKVGHHTIVIQHLKSVRDAALCHIVFIGREQSASFDTLMPILKNKPVLTVSDADNFMEASGILRLYTDKNKIRIEINAKEATNAQLEVNAKLLKLATLYNE